MKSETELFQELRPRAFAIAYRMLGSVSEADDIVQEAFLRLYGTLQQGDRIESPRAYISTVVTRLGIDQLRSARARRESYIGEWLPEPIVMTPDSDPASQVEMADSLSVAFLVLLENLSPEQRAAFLLRDVFDYPYEEIARIIGKSTDNARQLVTRARKHLEARRPRFETSIEQRDTLARSFLDAVEHGDIGTLEVLLAEDVVLHGDGGGKAPAIRQPLVGRARTIQALLSWARTIASAGTVSVRRVEVNGQPGAMVLDCDQRIISVLSLDIAGGKIQAINSVINPDKLRHLGPLADIRSILRGEERPQ